MEFTENEQRIIAVLMAEPTIDNATLANRTYMAGVTLNIALRGLYRKYGIVGAGAKRGILIAKIRGGD